MSIAERELTPAEKKQLKKYEKEISKKDFTKRYGKKEGAKIYYATLTKMAKEKVEEMYSSSGSRGHVRINLIKGGEEHAGHVERSQQQGLRNVMEDELEEKKDRRGASPSYCRNTSCDKMEVVNLRESKTVIEVKRKMKKWNFKSAVKRAIKHTLREKLKKCLVEDIETASRLRKEVIPKLALERNQKALEEDYIPMKTLVTLYLLNSLVLRQLKEL